MSAEIVRDREGMSLRIDQKTTLHSAVWSDFKLLEQLTKDQIAAVNVLLENVHHIAQENRSHEIGRLLGVGNTTTEIVEKS